MSVSSTIKTITTTIINLLKTRANGDLSNLTEMGESKLRLSRSVAGYYVGDIGIAVGGIDETENTRRYLNGQTVSLAQFPDFREWLKKRKRANKSVFVNTIAEWNAEASKSTFSQCGKFFYDETADTVKLPRIVNIQGTSDITALGKLTLAGLPNITGRIGALGEENTNYANGAFYQGGDLLTGHGGGKDYPVYMDASRSSAVYGRSSTVQPETLSFPYFIQVSVGAEAVTSVTNELELNNPFSLFDIRWSDHRIDNLSWLVSDGQLNEGNAYPSAYSFLIDQYDNGIDKVDTITYTSDTDFTKEVTVSINYRLGKNNMKITKDKTTYDKLVKETGTAWYYLIDTTTGGFYLPQTDGCLQGGNSNTLGQFTPSGLPDITGQFQGGGQSASTYQKGAFLRIAGGQAIANDGQPDDVYDFKASRAHVTYGRTKTTVQPNGVRGFLYFYVGECIQGTNLISFEGMRAQLSNELNTALNNMSKHRIVDSYTNNTSWYREYADGWCEQGGHIVADSVAKTSVTLLKPFKDTSYIVVFGNEYTGTASATSCVETATKATSSFVAIDSTTKTFSTYWVAYGYIK